MKGWGGKWRSVAIEAIEGAHKALPKDASLAAVRSALRAAYPFGERKRYPYIVWLDATRAYLASRFPAERERQAIRSERLAEAARVRRGFSPLPEETQLKLFGKAKSPGEGR